MIEALVASTPLVRATSQALTHARKRVARALAVRCLQRLPIPMEGVLLSSLTDTNTLVMCHARGPRAVGALVCGEEVDGEMERWEHDSARFHVAVMLDNLKLAKEVADPPGCLVDEGAASGAPRVFNLLQEQPLAKSWALTGRFEGKSGSHLVLEGDGVKYATLGRLVSQYTTRSLIPKEYPPLAIRLTWTAFCWQMISAATR